MKMRPEHYKDLRDLISANFSSAELEEKARLYRANGYGATIFLFDLLYSIPFGRRQIWFDEYEIYSYLDDRHIETALAAVFRELVGYSYEAPKTAV